MADEHAKDDALTPVQRSAGLVRRGLAEALTLQSSEAHYNRGLAKRKNGDYDGAIADFTKAIELDPGYAEAYYERGEAKRANLDYEDAIDDYTRAIEVNPQYWKAYWERGFAKKLIFDEDGAIDDLMIAAPGTPKDHISGILDDRFKATLENYDLDIEMRPIEEIDLHDPKACRNIAKVYYRRGLYRSLMWDDFDIDDYNMAIEIDPGYAEAYYERGNASCDYDGAMKDYTQAIEINPRFAAAYFKRAILKNNLHDADGATSDRAAAGEIDPRYAQEYYNSRFEKYKPDS
jgi:tetratricopeptide (TPR) repeat protein